MPAIEKIYPELLGQTVAPMRTLARDEGVDAHFGNFCNFAAGPTGDDGDPRNLLGPGRTKVDPAAENLLKPGH